MKRRNFIQNTLKGAMVPFFMSGSGMNSMARATFLPAGVCNYNNRALVVIHLNGANDIINTAVPLAQMSAYNTHRPTLNIAQNKLITLDDSLPDEQQLGLNPGLSAFKNLYDDGKLAFVQRAGYPKPNRSHFASQEIWFKGIDGNIGINKEEEGWIGRFLKDRYPTFKGLPFGDQPDPLGILLASGSDTGFHTNEQHNVHINLTGQDPAGFYNIMSSISGQPINAFQQTEQGEMLQYMAAIEKSTQFYSQRISSVFNAGMNSSKANYKSNSLGNQLKSIARFLSGGSTTKVFLCRTGGWDSHGNQVNKEDTATGSHRNLLEDLSKNLQAFQDDLTDLGMANRVTTVVFSEFGRKIKENGNFGTDHGTLSSMFVVGDAVKRGVYGDGINLNDQDSRSAPNPAQLQNDYRGVFASILKDWMGANDSSIQNAFSKTSATILSGGPSLIKNAKAVDASCYFNQIQPTTLKLKVQVHLEGLFDTSTGKLKTDLVKEGVLPLNQPFGNTYFGYFGNESVEALPIGTSDWVLGELRTKTGLATVARKPFLINENGWLTELDGSQPIDFPNLHPGEYHLALFHQSHIAVLTTATTNVSPAITNTIKIDGQGKVQGSNQLKRVGEKMVIISGDVNQDGTVNANDYLALENSVGKKGYHPTDLNADGKVRSNEKTILNKNRSRIGLPDLFQKMLMR